MALELEGPLLVLDGTDCLYTAIALAEAVALRARRDGGVPPRMQELAEKAVATARKYQAATLAGSDIGTDRFRDEPAGAVFVPSATTLTVEQAAHLLGCSPGFVRRLLRQRELTGSRAGGRGAWRVDGTSVVERLGVRRTEAA
jgi:excisionase family DNA binding protein